MNVLIINPANGRVTDYRAAELRRDAIHAVKGKGRLESYWVEVTDGVKNGVRLVAQYVGRDGMSGQVFVAI